MSLTVEWCMEINISDGRMGPFCLSQTVEWRMEIKAISFWMDQKEINTSQPSPTFFHQRQKKRPGQATSLGGPTFLEAEWGLEAPRGVSQLSSEIRAARHMFNFVYEN